jgi:hypothetical protein
MKKPELATADGQKIREGAAKKSEKQKKSQGKKGSLRELERGRHFVERGAALCLFRH